MSSYVNVVHARTIVETIRDDPERITQQIVGNVVMFAPLGFLLPLLGARYRRFAMTAAAGLAVPLGVELTQLVLLLTLAARRTVDVDDVILNLTGACLGYLAWQAAQTFAARSPWPVADSR